MEILFPIAVLGMFILGWYHTKNEHVKQEVPYIPQYDIECEAGEFPLRTDLIQPAIDVMKKCGYKVADAKKAINAVIVERPTIDSVGDVVRAAVLMLQVGGI